MSKALSHIHDEYESYESEESFEETPKISKQEYQLYQNDEKYDLVSNMYDFLKEYMESRDFVFPIMEHFSIKSVIHFVNNFTTPRQHA